MAQQNLEEYLVRRVTIINAVAGGKKKEDRSKSEEVGKIISVADSNEFSKKGVIQKK